MDCPSLLQGCGLPWDPPNPNFKPFYWKNYLAFYGALRAAHPGLHLIANCHLGDLAPTEIWEYHVGAWAVPCAMGSKGRRAAAVGGGLKAQKSPGIDGAKAELPRQIASPSTPPAPPLVLQVYTNPQDMYGRRHAFDGMTPQANGLVFASEYAVTGEGGSGGGREGPTTPATQ